MAMLRDPAPMVLVSVAAIAGSTPREAGAFMLISRTKIAGTIGGGNLEHQVTEQARRMLRDDTVPNAKIVRYPLGPGLGQCCGGSVSVAFHAVDAARKVVLGTALQSLENGECDPDGVMSSVWVLMPLGNVDGKAMARTGREFVLDRTALARAMPDAIVTPDQTAQALEQHFGLERGGVVKADGHMMLALRMDRGATPLWIFGAGHVGQAIVRAVSPLPFAMTWVDSRAEFIDPVQLPRVRTIHSPDPRQEVGDIPPGAMVLILTHSHTEDFDICKAALMRRDLGFVGMIGSETKRSRFIRRLRDRGLGEGEIARMTCPIGMPGVSGKHPAVIAASVATQLLVMREAIMAKNLDDPAHQSVAG
jgi:xanthine dehydrogenase accessory factor